MTRTLRSLSAGSQRRQPSRGDRAEARTCGHMPAEAQGVSAVQENHRRLQLGACLPRQEQGEGRLSIRSPGRRRSCDWSFSHSHSSFPVRSLTTCSITCTKRRCCAPRFGSCSGTSTKASPRWRSWLSMRWPSTSARRGRRTRLSQAPSEVRRMARMTRSLPPRTCPASSS